jgi:hypothetical protein
MDRPATAGPFSEIRAFATGLLADHDGVVAGLTQLWSSGPVEGHVNPIILWNQRPSMGGRTGPFAWVVSVSARAGAAPDSRRQCSDIQPLPVVMWRVS